MCSSNRRENIFNVVSAAQQDVTSAKNSYVRAVATENQILPAQVGATGHTPYSAEPENLRQRGRVGWCPRVIGIQHRCVPLGLILENSRLHSSISFERAVTIQMVRRQIQQDAYIWPELADQFELKTAQFNNRHARIGGFFNAGDERRTNIAGKNRSKFSLLKNMGGEGRGGGLPIRTCDSHEPSAQEPASEFDLAPNCDALVLCRSQRGKIRRHTWAGNN